MRVNQKSPVISKTMWMKVAVFTLIRLVLNTSFRMVYPYLTTFQVGMGVSLSQITTALSARSLAGVLTPFIAIFSDRRGRKTGMLLGLGFFIAGMLSIVILQSFIGFVIGMILSLLGKLTFDPSMLAYLGEETPFDRRGNVLAITELSWSFAFLLGVPLVGVLLTVGNWILPYTAILILSIAGLIMVLRIQPKDVKQPDNGMSFWEQMGLVFKKRSTLAALVVALLVGVGNETVNIVFGVWIENTFNVKLAVLGAASVVIGFAELTGEGLVSVYVDRIGKKRSVVIGVALFTVSSIFLPLISFTLAGAMVGLFIFYLTFEITFVALVPMMTELVPEARATLLAVTISVISIGRAATDYFGPFFIENGIVSSVTVTVITGILALIALRFVVLPESKQIGQLMWD